MSRTFTLILTVAAVTLAQTAAAQDRSVLPAKTGKGEVRSEPATRIIAASLNLNAQMTQALDGDPALKASVEKDILAIRNEKNKGLS